MPAADDFFHTYMGEDPVILTRDGEGRLHALLNMCRQRGNRVCRVDDGNAKRRALPCSQSMLENSASKPCRAVFRVPQPHY